MRRPLPVGALLVAGLVAVLAWRTRDVFEGGHLPLAAVVAPLAAAALAVVVPPQPRWLRWALQAALVVAATAAAVSAAGGEVGTDVGPALTRGLASNLAAQWPVPPEPVAVGGVVAVIALLGALAVELAAARLPGAVALVPVAALVALLGLLTAPAGAPPLGLLVLVGAGAVAVLRAVEIDRRRRRRDPADRPDAPLVPSSAVLATGAVAMVGVVVTGAVLAHLVRWDPRDDIELPSEAQQDISPLSRVDGWRRLQPAEVMFRMGSYRDRTWRLVALTRYDGRSWMPSAEYRPAGRDLRPAPEGAPLDRTSVELEALGLPWLPAPDGVISVSEPVSTDPSVGGLLRDEAPVAGFSYEVTAAAVEPATTATEATEPGQIIIDTPLPAEWVQLAGELTAGARSDYERALLLAARLRRDYDLDVDAPGGHSMLVLDGFLDRRRPGREEQFVAAYAALAAALDLPVRVVVGFEPEPADGGAVARSSGVRAWPEVEFVGAGWLPFDPVPDEDSAESSGDGDEVAAPADAEPLPGPQTPETTPPTTAPPPVDLGEGSDAGGFPTPPPAVVGGGLALLAVAAYLGGVAWLKERRRSRRRQGPPEVQVTGAFSSGVETLVDLGAPARRSATNRELVSAGAPAARGDVAPLDELGELATAAVFARQPPDEIEARLAWTRLEDFERRAATSVGRLRWLRSRFSLRSLRRRL